MKKTVVFDFPEDFQFPDRFENVDLARCTECPLFCRDDEGDEWCFLLGYSETTYESRCPFRDEADIVAYN